MLSSNVIRAYDVPNVIGSVQNGELNIREIGDDNLSAENKIHEFAYRFNIIRTGSFQQ